MKIVMTGATSGIGLVAANVLLEDGAELMIGARSPAAAPAGLGRGATIASLDLERLDSVRSFAAAVEEWLGDAVINQLVLNAGMQVGDVRQRTEDGL
ncbi:MAG: SDR family NAD(P)-dependent oxidoreductase, partial [Rhodanobacter sp.]